jgi:serine/threonine protein phosphatase PrpC
MVLIQWLERGLGQIVAPDRSYEAHPEEVDTASLFWQLVAPDPNFTVEPNQGGPPPHAFLHSSQMVRCVHCHQFTPLYNPTATTPGSRNTKPSTTTNTPAAESPSSALAAEQEGGLKDVQTVTSPSLTTPSKQGIPVVEPETSYATPQSGTTAMKAFFNNNSNFNNDDNTDVWKHVVTAVQQTAHTLASPPLERQRGDALFRLVSNAHPLQDKALQRLSNQLSLDVILQARSSQLGQLCPDGYTLFLAAAYANQVDAAKRIVQVVEADAASETPSTEDSSSSSPNHGLKKLLHQVNLQGKNALHVAAERGHLEMLEYLKTLYPPLETSTSLDILGRTALGVALTSPEPKAHKHEHSLYKTLYTPSDVSLWGSPLPARQRQVPVESLQCIMATAHIPGKRIRNEDAYSCQVLQPSSSLKMACVGVCDGHGDGGHLSEWLAHVFPIAMQEQLAPLNVNTLDVSTWTEIISATALALDDEWRRTQEQTSSSKASDWNQGGSTALWTLITPTDLVVANVGDSRCILIQILDDELKQAETSTSGEDTGLEASLAQLSLTRHKNRNVIALSTDHKPNLPHERERVEKAGLEVTEETYNDFSGNTQTVSRIVRHPTNRLACSRSFGDYEYKTLANRPPEEQAVIALPEVRLQPRDAAQDALLVVACDGIWDVMSNEQVADFVLGQFEQERVRRSNETANTAAMTKMDALLSTVGDSLLSECLQRGSSDNLTVVLVAFSPWMERCFSSSSRPGVGKTLNFNEA